MQLVPCNAQGQLHSLERGEHARLAVESGMAIADYARSAKVELEAIKPRLYAATVVRTTKLDWEQAKHYVGHLSLIHAAPEETIRTQLHAAKVAVMCAHDFGALRGGTHPLGLPHLELTL